MAEIKPLPIFRRESRWSYDLRRWVIIGLVIAFAFLCYWIRDTLPTFIIALLVAYLLNPIVSLVERRMRRSRLAATGLVYLVLVAVVAIIPALLVPSLVRQITGLISQLDNIVAQISDAVRQVPLWSTLGIEQDSQVISTQIRGELAVLARQSPALIIGAASRVFNILIILVLSFYLLKDSEMLERRLEEAVPEEYRPEAARIKQELIEIWSGFLRGQIILALIIGVVTTIALTVLGVRNALLLGLLAGIMEVVPTIGPIISAVPAVLIAFFQGSTIWPLEGPVFALVIVITYLLIQQLENHLIVPNVLGRSVNLPAVVILFGALAGASLAGVLGIFLAAPVIATSRLILQFLFRKLLEPLPGDSRQVERETGIQVDK